jgi:hypothetical protein
LSQKTGILASELRIEQRFQTKEAESLAQKLKYTSYLLLLDSWWLLEEEEEVKVDMDLTKNSQSE